MVFLQAVTVSPGGEVVETSSGTLGGNGMATTNGGGTISIAVTGEYTNTSLLTIAEPTAELKGPRIYGTKTSFHAKKHSKRGKDGTSRLSLVSNFVKLQFVFPAPSKIRQIRI